MPFVSRMRLARQTRWACRGRRQQNPWARPCVSPPSTTSREKRRRSSYCRSFATTSASMTCNFSLALLLSNLAIASAPQQGAYPKFSILPATVACPYVFGLNEALQVKHAFGLRAQAWEHRLPKDEEPNQRDAVACAARHVHPRPSRHPAGQEPLHRHVATGDKNTK